MTSKTFIPYRSRYQKADTRKTAIRMLKKGVSQAEAARLNGVSRSAVSKWWKAYQEKGRAIFKQRFSPGRPTRLTHTQKKELKKMITKSPIVNEWETDLWTTMKVASLIKQEFGVSYHPDHIGKLLHEMGFSWQRPQRKAAKNTEKEKKRWIKSKSP